MRERPARRSRSSLATPRSIPFTEFAERVLRLKLTRGQRVLARVAFDGVQPADMTGADRETARQMFGGADEVPPGARRVQTHVLGRGSGKTTLAAAFGLYTTLTGDVSSCGPGDVPVVVVIAPDKKTAGLSVRMALELARSNPDIKRLMQSDTADGFTLRRPDGRLVGLEAFAATRGGSSARGRSILSFVLDEAQFFRSDDGGAYVVNDRDIYRALIPRLMPGGLGILISTPWPVETLMGELFAKNFGAPMSALASKAPTLLMRDNDEHLARIIAEERDRDPENTSREFDCDTTVGGGGTFFDATAVQDSVDDVPRPLAHVAHWPVAVGADFGFRSDSSALVVVQYDGKQYHVAEILELRPARGKPLQPSAVVAEFAAVAKCYGASAVIADGHYRESIREHLIAHGLAILPAPEGLGGKLETYTRTRAVLHEGNLRLPNQPRLLAQLRGVLSRPTPGGGLTITSPRRAGSGHGDIVSALVLGVHRLAHRQVTEPDLALDPLRAEQDRMRREAVRHFKPAKRYWS